MALVIVAFTWASAAPDEATSARNHKIVVVVSGAVGKPGRVTLHKDQKHTIVEAITSAGGMTQFADVKRVRLIRKKADGTTATFVINVDALMKAGGRDAPALEADDAIYVSERD